MISLNNPIVFNWDEGNINKNLNKHNVNVQEAEQVFYNEPLFIYDDILHSTHEERFKALGTTSEGRKLVVVFTLRNSKLRVISTRDMSKKERGQYEKS
jgi:hypothetical protein